MGASALRSSAQQMVGNVKKTTPASREKHFFNGRKVNAATALVVIRVCMGLPRKINTFALRRSMDSVMRIPPYMVLSGEMDVEGTNPYAHDIYTFRNGQYIYEFLGFTVCSEGEEPKNTLGSLIVKKGNKTLLKDYCVR